MQTGYRILVASSTVRLGNGDGDVWDSGQVQSDRAVDVVYAGVALASGTRYFWKVMVWNQAHQASPWSEARWFETGLLQAHDWQGAWIGRNAEPDPAPMVRRDFTADRPIASARLYVCGLGFYEARINGRKVGDRVLEPPMSQYNRLAYYTTYDVTTAIATGVNAIGVELGRSWYCLTGAEGGAWGWDQAWWRKYPEVIVQLNITYADGTTASVVSDGSWTACADGPLRHDSVYAGDVYDARKEKAGWDLPRYHAGPEWRAADIMPPPGGNGSIAKLRANMIPPCRVVATEKPVSVTRVGDHQVFRLAHNVAGWVRLKGTAPAGTTITIAHGERLQADGTVAVHRMDGKFDCQKYAYTFKGNGLESYEPKFSYSGFLFVEVVGFPRDLTVEDIDVRIVHNDVATIGSFSCADPLLDSLHEGFVRTVQNNLNGKPTDTPMYEKNGWMGDFNFICRGALYAFDLTNFLEKWDDDIAAYQADNGGCTGVLCPAGHADQNFGPPWNTVAVTVPWELLRFCGDRMEMEKHYDHIKSLDDWLWSRLDEHHLSPNECWGPDWSTPSGDPAEGSQLTHSCYVYAAIREQASMATMLGRGADAKTYGERADAIREAVNSRCYDAMAKMYHTSKACGFRQTSNVMPFGFDMVPDGEKAAVIANLAHDVMDVRGGHLWTGAVGTPFILPALAGLSIPGTGYVVTTDIGEPWDLHPYRKDVVGHRLALWALAKTYHCSDVVYSGPIYKAMSIDGGIIHVEFESIGSGLASRDGHPLSHFEIAGADGLFVPATATIAGARIDVRSAAVDRPTAVRFGWNWQHPRPPEPMVPPNLINREGLPAAPFNSEPKYRPDTAR